MALNSTIENCTPEVATIVTLMFWNSGVTLFFFNSTFVLFAHFLICSSIVVMLQGACWEQYIFCVFLYLCNRWMICSM